MPKISPLFKKHFPESPARAVICMSGSGSNAEVLLRESAEGKRSYKVELIFTDSPEKSNAVELGRRFNIPVELLDIRKFYKEHGESSISLNTPQRRELRELWSGKVWEKIQKYRCDFAIFAGFVPLTNLAEKLPALNVHPGDLTIEKDGVRIYAGLHCEPVENAILDGREFLRSSVILVQGYSGNGKKDLDSGEILGISAPVAIELDNWDIDELKKIREKRTGQPFKDELRSLALENIEKLKCSGDHIVFPQTVEMFASGRYGTDSSGTLYWYSDGGKWIAVKSVEYFSDAAPEAKMVNDGVKKVKKGKILRVFRYFYIRMVRENGTPEYIARGWALGMFIGCVIPVFCQLVISVPLSFIFRGSKIGAALGTFITTPPTAVFIYPIQIWVGNKIINGNLNPSAGKELLRIFNDESIPFIDKWGEFIKMGWDLVAAFFAGGLAWAAIMTPLTYFGVRGIVIRYRKIRKKIVASKKDKLTAL